MGLSIRGITKRHGGTAALRGIDLELPAAGYVCIMGPSGCGKTTLLRILAGLVAADGGSIAWDGRVLDDVPAERRPLRLVFQHGALFPHLDVGANVGFALALAGLRSEALAREVTRLLALVELPAAFAGRTIEGLSGGERQRVALARALAGDPAVLMLDEPLTAIDRPQRAGLRDRLRSLQRERGGLFVHVTHDPAEALALADHLVVLDRGVVLAQGDPEALYTRPPDAATARLLGGLSAVPGSETRSLRCERLRIAEVQPRAHGRVVSRAVLGELAEIVVVVGSQRVSLHAPLEVRAAVDDTVGLRWEDDDELPFAAGSA